MPHQNSAPTDRIGGKTAAGILGLKQGAFNNQRKALQLVYNRQSGESEPYPPYQVIEALYRASSAYGGVITHRRKDPAESWYQSTHWLLVPEWGGSKPPHGSWSYSRRRIQGFLDSGL